MDPVDNNIKFALSIKDPNVVFYKYNYQVLIKESVIFASKLPFIIIQIDSRYHIKLLYLVTLVDTACFKLRQINTLLNEPF